MVCEILVRSIARNTEGTQGDNVLGEVVTVQEINWNWSPRERKHFAVIRVTGVSVTDARDKLLLPIYKGFELVENPTFPLDVNGIPLIPEAKNQRRFPVDNVALRALLLPQARSELDNAFDRSKTTPKSKIPVVTWQNLGF